MSRSNAPKQATIDKWCNEQAVTAWADRLDRWADQLSPMFERTTEFCHPNCTHDQDRDDAVNLRHAANLLRESAKMAGTAANTATNHAYDKIYGRTA